MCRLGLWDFPELFFGDADKLSENYPGNIIYNAVCTGKYFIHNLKYTDRSLMQAARDRHRKNKDELSISAGEGQPLETIHVAQGYTRCTCLPVTDDSFITSDMGIAGKLISAGADVLTIKSGYIELPGFDYGFIGGCAGHLFINEKPVVIFNGNLPSHPDFPQISSFIQERGIEILFFEDYPLTDIGSILAD